MLKEGWYRVTLENLKPKDDEVQFYDEWVEFDGVRWLLSDLPDHKVINVIKKEGLKK